MDPMRRANSKEQIERNVAKRGKAKRAATEASALHTAARYVHASFAGVERRYRNNGIGDTIIEGTSTCATGKITIRAFDTKGKWLGNGESYIRAYAFETYIDNLAAPSKMSINYVIE
jgi:hypothetical protein